WCLWPWCRSRSVLPGGSDSRVRALGGSVGVGLNHGGRTLGRNGGPLVGRALVAGTKVLELGPLIAVGALVAVAALLRGGGGVGAGGGVVVAELASGCSVVGWIPGGTPREVWLGDREEPCVVARNTGCSCGWAIRVGSGLVDSAPGTAIDNK